MPTDDDAEAPAPEGYHIFRITCEDNPIIVLSRTEMKGEGITNSAIASFVSAALRDLAFAAFAREIKGKPELYPQHRVK